jgi:hypothetical protein
MAKRDEQAQQQAEQQERDQQPEQAEQAEQQVTAAQETDTTVPGDSQFVNEAPRDENGVPQVEGAREGGMPVVEGEAAGE